jgi:hypothetical protein
MAEPDASRMEIRTGPLPLTSTLAPPTREGEEGEANVTKSIQNAVKLIEEAESTTQNCERSRPRAREDENTKELKGHSP